MVKFIFKSTIQSTKCVEKMNSAQHIENISEIRNYTKYTYLLLCL